MQELDNDFVRLTLVLGGARSGKSRYAEGLVTCAPAPWFYIATAQAHDDEMRERIFAHRMRRHEGWRTFDEPLNLANAIHEAPPGTPILVDCLTIWLANLMLAERDIDAEICALINVCLAASGPLVLVSNEVGFGIVPENDLARKFRDRAGALHQRLGEIVDRCTLVVAGFPIHLK